MLQINLSRTHSFVDVDGGSSRPYTRRFCPATDYHGPQFPGKSFSRIIALTDNANVPSY